MALTDDQITAKNFRDFYDTIFPYLSGAVHAGFTPVGTIINVIGTTAPANYLKCDGATYSITQYLPLATYIKNQFGSYNHFGGDGVTTFAVPTKAGGTDDIYCIAIRDLNVDLYVNYSENEQVIGTWMGKPLYQKTIYISALPSSRGIGTYPHEIANIEQVWIYDGFSTNSSYNGNPLNLCRPDSSLDTQYGANVDPINIYIRVGLDRSSDWAYVTLRYTKTTDQPTP